MSPRARKTTAARSTTLTCPECGRTFTRAAALGAHRSRVHGVPGSSRTATGSRTKTKGRKTATRAIVNHKTTTTRKSTPARRKAATSRTSNRGGPSPSGPRRSTVSRDTLLQSLFPNGIPARQEVIQRVNRWLDEAEQLARLR